MNHEAAKVILHDAFTKCQCYVQHSLAADHQTKISTLILGSHLTFRYILLTALLAKSTDSSINMLSLQAGADFTGAYDARSLCHKVIVPFEKEKLQGRLGNSNEPYLNKPARFTCIDPTNPVRRGSDKYLLDLLYNLLTELNSKDGEYAKEALCYALNQVMLRDIKDVLLVELPVQEVSYTYAATILNSFLASSYEGQSSVAVTGSIMRMLYPDATVVIHPANQAGASSREVGDIDVKIHNTQLYAIEVKDKDFSDTDVWHAVEKVKSSGFSKLIFLQGRHAKTSIDINSMIATAESNGFDLTFVYVDNLAFTLLAAFGEEERRLLLNHIYQALLEMRAKDEAISAYKGLLNI